MSTNKWIWLPALLAILAALVLWGYSFSIPHVRSGHNAAEELFKNLGTAAVFLGAVSFLWLRFKSLRKSGFVVIKRVSRWIHAIHQASGYAALAVILIHGWYFWFNVKAKPETYTGLSALAVIVAITGYGLLIRNVRNAWTRTIHRTLGFVWIPFLLIHAGGSAIMAVFLSLAIWGLTWYLDRKA